MDISKEISKYKEERLRTLDAKIDELSGIKQLSICLLALERLYKSYFMKYDKTGTKYFKIIIEAIEDAISGSKSVVINDSELDKLDNWCERCLDKLDDDKLSEWKKCAIEILFPDYICPFTESLDGICLQKNPAEFGDIYKIGVDLCELYELDFLNTSAADFMSIQEFIATRHKDVAEALEIATKNAKLYQQNKLPRQDYFKAIDHLDDLCSKYPEDGQLYSELTKKHLPNSPEDMSLMCREIERISDDIAFLDQGETIDIPLFLERARAYRKVDILQLS